MIPLKDENPTETFPFVTILFIVMNAAVFAYEMFLGETNIEPFVRTMAVVPVEIGRGLAVREYPTLLTSLFLHGGLLHLLGNMLYLWIFGNNIEDALGHFRFILFYLLCGALASVTHIVLNASSNVPVIGASGAISGVLGAYLILYPRARVLTLVPLFFFIRIIRLPAFVIIGMWIVFQIVQGLPSLAADSAGGGVAWFAHIGGFFAGIALLPLFIRPRQVKRLEHV